MNPSACSSGFEPGIRRALAELFERHRDRLRRMVDCAWTRGSMVRSTPPTCSRTAFSTWRSGWTTICWNPAAGVSLAATGRQRSSGDVPPPPPGHGDADAGREVSLYRDPLPQASSAALASMLLGRLTSPSDAAIRAELILQVQEAINSLDPLDREVVALRHFENLTRAETAVVLGITEEAGAKRYIRAIKKLKTIMAAMPGGLEGF